MEIDQKDLIADTLFIGGCAICMFISLVYLRDITLVCYCGVILLVGLIGKKIIRG